MSWLLYEYNWLAYFPLLEMWQYSEDFPATVQLIQENL